MQAVSVLKKVKNVIKRLGILLRHARHTREYLQFYIVCHSSWLQRKTLKKVHIHINHVSFYIWLPPFKVGPCPKVEKIQKVGYGEAAITELMFYILEEKDVFWDLGGGCGYHTLLAAQVINRHQNIHIFEPGLVRNILKYNLNYFSINANIIPLYISDIVDLKRNKITGDYYTQKYCKDMCPVDVIKMDIDGGEIEAIKGLKKIIHQYQPLFLIEVHPKVLGENHKFIFNYLSKAGYHIMQLLNFREIDWLVRKVKLASEITVKGPDYQLLAYKTQHIKRFKRISSLLRETK